MPAARAQRPSWPVLQQLIGVVADALRNPRGAADELDEARELLAYWEQRARRLPRWALKRRREAHAMAFRWREHGELSIAPPLREGFGSKLIKDGLAGASVQHDVKADGLECLIRMSLTA